MERKSDLLVVASTHVASPTTPTVSTLRPASAPFEPPRAERAAARLRSPSTNPPRVDLYSLPSPVSPPSRLPPSPPSSPICRPATLHPPSATVPRKLERAPPFDPADSHPPRPSVEPPDRHPPIRRPNSILYGLQVSPSRLPTPCPSCFFYQTIQPTSIRCLFFRHARYDDIPVLRHPVAVADTPPLGDASLLSVFLS